MAENPILHYYKNLPLPTFVNVEIIIVAVKHMQLVFLFTQFMIYKETLLINGDLFSHGSLHNYFAIVHHITSSIYKSL